jgi:hypothetical protein
MDCPRCGGHIAVFELGEAVSQVCEDCSYVGVLADHRLGDTAIESWDDALTRFQTEFSAPIPDGVTRVDDDTAPPSSPADDETTGDSGFQLRGSPESTIVAESVPEPGTDFPVEETGANVLEGSNATTVEAPGTDSEPRNDDGTDQSETAEIGTDSEVGATDDESTTRDTAPDGSGDVVGRDGATDDDTDDDSMEASDSREASTEAEMGADREPEPRSGESTVDTDHSAPTEGAVEEDQLEDDARSNEGGEPGADEAESGSEPTDGE